MNRHSLKTGLSFGMTSGIITTLGLMIGLDRSTNSQLAVIGGILTIAIADAFSDALGIHVSEESESKHSSKEIWQSTLFTFLFKLIAASSFLVPVFALPLQEAVMASVVWGLFLLATLSFFVAKDEGKKPVGVIAEHLAVAGLVIAVTYFVGGWIAVAFGSGP